MKLMAKFILTFLALNFILCASRQERLVAEKAIAKWSPNKYFEKVVQFLPSVKVPILSTHGNSCMMIINSRPGVENCNEMESSRKKLFQFISKGYNAFQIQGYDGRYLQVNTNGLEFVHSSSLSPTKSLWTIKVTSDKKLVIKSQTEKMCLDIYRGNGWWSLNNCNDPKYQKIIFPIIDDAIRKAEKAQAQKRIRSSKRSSHTKRTKCMLD